jgi:hypothetical protein
VVDDDVVTVTVEPELVVRVIVEPLIDVTVPDACCMAAALAEELDDDFDELPDDDLAPVGAAPPLGGVPPPAPPPPMPASVEAIVPLSLMVVAAILVDDPLPLTWMLSPTPMLLRLPVADVVTLVDDVVTTFLVVELVELDPDDVEPEDPDEPGAPKDVALMVMVDPSMEVIVPTVPMPPPGPRRPDTLADAAELVEPDELMAFTPKMAVAATTTVPTTPMMRFRRVRAGELCFGGSPGSSAHQSLGSEFSLGVESVMPGPRS